MEDFTMKKTVAVLFAIAICAVGSAYALYSVSNEGTWPKSWRKELEPPLRANNE
jgi:hypothetical protein